MTDLYRFDGMSVSLYDGKFSGSFECDPAQAAEIAMDSEQYYIVRATAKGANHALTKSGDLKRTNIYAISEAVPVSHEVGLKLVASGSAQLSLLAQDDEDEDDDFDEEI